MKRFLPNSLLGQVMLVLAFGLMVAQALSAFLLYQAAEQRRESGLVNALAFRIAGEDQRMQLRQRYRADDRASGLDRPRFDRRGERRRFRPLQDENGPRIRRFRFAVQQSEDAQIGANDTRMPSYEDALRTALIEQGFNTQSVLVTRRQAGGDPFVRGRIALRPRPPAADWAERSIVVASVERAEGGWLTARVPEPRAPRNALRTILLQTAVIFTILFGLLYLLLRRITRPLAQLTARVGDFSRNPDQAQMIEERGPADMRRLIAAHNAMETRIAALLDEKDVMLGAIGHDLKTPLAALRVRIESVPDDTQRTKMAESIEDITHTLDDILSLARVGRTSQAPDRVDLSALAASVVEEFEDLGQPVSLHENARVIAPVHATWAKRALRNLVSNAVRYGGGARISVEERAGFAVMRVDDDGPGIPEDALADMLEPFTRGEASRNRSTGGAGLGLTLARAIAEQHGGTLQLSNRSEGGLRAEIRLPSG